MTVDPSAVTAPESGASRGEPAPSAVGKYRLDRMIGSGGMGMVWAAFDPDLERAVAVKLLHADSSEPTLRSRLLREARAMARLRHPNVVTVFDVGTDQNRDYIAMELIEGTSLDAWFDTKPTQHEIVEALTHQNTFALTELIEANPFRRDLFEHCRRVVLLVGRKGFDLFDGALQGLVHGNPRWRHQSLHRDGTSCKRLR